MKTEARKGFSTQEAVHGLSVFRLWSGGANASFYTVTLKLVSSFALAEFVSLLLNNNKSFFRAHASD